LTYITGKIQLFLLGLLLLTKSVYSQELPNRPNIIVILIDDMGWNDTGFSGNELIETPGLDSLAGRSIIITNAFTDAPNCVSSRASLLTGLYTFRYGIYTVAAHNYPPGNRAAGSCCVLPQGIFQFSLGRRDLTLRS